MSLETSERGRPPAVGRWVVPAAVLLVLVALGTVVVLSGPGQPGPKSRPTTVPTTQGALFPRTRPGAEKRVRERARMLRDLRRHRPPVTDQRVLAAMRAVPRHKFVRPRDQWAAYADRPVEIGLGQTISQPYIVALMSELLETKPGDRVLEIGTGSGYQAAVLADMGCEVYTIEIVRELGASAAKRLGGMRYTNVQSKVADGYFGWKEHAPYDAIVVTCAATHVPPALLRQLKPGGRICIPVGPVLGAQDLIVVTRRPDGRFRSRSVIPVRFVPLTGRHDQR